MFKEYKSLIISILIPLGLGLLVGLITSGGVSNLDNLVLPSFQPPGWLFAVVWPILYTLMGISAYLIDTSYMTNEDNFLSFFLYFAPIQHFLCEFKGFLFFSGSSCSLETITCITSPSTREVFAKHTIAFTFITSHQDFCTIV